MGFGNRLWDLGVVGPVDKTVGFHACLECDADLFVRDVSRYHVNIIVAIYY